VGIPELKTATYGGPKASKGLQLRQYWTHHSQEKVHVGSFVYKEPHRMVFYSDPNNEVWWCQWGKWIDRPVMVRMNQSLVQVQYHDLSTHRNYRITSIF